MARFPARRIALALAALFALQLGAALASAAPCAVACCPEMAAAGEADAAPCHSLSPVSCCAEGIAVPAPEASAPPVGAPGALVDLPAPAAAPARASLRVDARVVPAASLRSVVLRL
jgi:hypothetical protein